MSRETFGQSLGEVRHGRLLFDGDGLRHIGICYDVISRRLD